MNPNFKGQLGFPIRIRERPVVRVADSKPKKKTRVAKLVQQALMQFPTGHPVVEYHIKPNPPTKEK